MGRDRMFTPSHRRQICGDFPKRRWRGRRSTPSRTASRGCAGESSRGRDEVWSIPDVKSRAHILSENFDAPNPDDSFRSLAEQVLEDVIVGGFGAIELENTGDPLRPLTLWPVDGASIRIKGDWDGLPGSPRYAADHGKAGTRGTDPLNDDELIYIRLNPRTHTPFGLGRLEVAFETINAFLGANRYAARLASNSVVEYALWLQGLSARTPRAVDPVVAG